jgi:hypothetical protein
MSVPPLAARDIEDSRPGRQAEEVDKSGDFGAISLGGKEWSVLEEIVGVEGGLPPLF